MLRIIGEEEGEGGRVMVVVGGGWSL